MLSLVWANDLAVVKQLFKIAYARHKITPAVSSV